MAERSPFPARTPIAAADGRASLPFSRWLLNEFAALSDIRTTVITGALPLTSAAYPQPMTTVAVTSATYAADSAAPIFANYAGGDPLSVAPASYPGADAIPLPFGDY